MKKLLLTGLLLAALALSGCGGRGGLSVNALPPEFFSQRIEGEITVSVYDTMGYRGFLEEAALAFEALYPGVKVNIETFSAMAEIRTAQYGDTTVSVIQLVDDAQSRADYISRVNTRIMSGGGADIYAMDILPLHRFIQSGALENLDRYMDNDPDFNRSDYRQNILDAVRFRGGTWFLPLDYTFFYYTYDRSLVPAEIADNFGIDRAYSVEDLLSIGAPLYNGDFKLFDADSYRLFRMLLGESIHSYADLETGRADFTDGRFASLLQTAKYLGDHGYIQQGAVNRTIEEIIEQHMLNLASGNADKFLFKQGGSLSLVSHICYRLGITAEMFAGDWGEDEIAGVAANARLAGSPASVPFTYTQAYGVNSQSGNKAAAWAFLKFLLCHEMQLSPNLNYACFPVNNSARREKAALVFAGMQGGSLDETGFSDLQLQGLAAYREAAEGFSDLVNTFNLRDPNLDDMVMEEARLFFTGARTAGETAGVIQNKAALYLGEQ